MNPVAEKGRAYLDLSLARVHVRIIEAIESENFKEVAQLRLEEEGLKTVRDRAEELRTGYESCGTDTRSEERVVRFHSVAWSALKSMVFYFARREDAGGGGECRGSVLP